MAVMGQIKKIIHQMIHVMQITQPAVLMLPKVTMTTPVPVKTATKATTANTAKATVNIAPTGSVLWLYGSTVLRFYVVPVSLLKGYDYEYGQGNSYGHDHTYDNTDDYGYGHCYGGGCSPDHGYAHNSNHCHC